MVAERSCDNFNLLSISLSSLSTPGVFLEKCYSLFISSIFLNSIITDDGPESPIDHGEESIRSSSAGVGHSTLGAAPEASVAINSDPADVSPTGPVSPDCCVAGASDAMTDVVITTKPGSISDGTGVSNINRTEPGTAMVMNRIQSREMETKSDVDIVNTNNEDDVAATRNCEGPRVIGGVEWPAPRAFDLSLIHI